MIELFIPGEPKAKQRPRHCKSGFTFTPQQTVEYERHVQNCITEQLNQTLPIWGRESLLHAAIRFIFLRPESKREKRHKRTGAILKQAVRFMTSKPDVDNLIKAILDPANKLLYADDSQVFSVSAIKEYTDDPREVGARVTIRKYKEVQDDKR